MFESAIRTISVARCSPIAAAARFERKVQIWDVGIAELISELDTVFEFGGKRLTLSADGKYCVVASFRAGQNGGVVCYEAKSGRSVWHRADLRKVQGVRFSSSGKSLWCVVEDRPVLSLDIDTGSTLCSLKSIRQVFDSPFTAHLLQVPHERDNGLSLVGSRTLPVPRLSFSILDAAFSPDALCLSEANGPVRCLCLENANERWRYLPPTGSHVLGLSYQSDHSFYGVQWSYEKGGPVMLLQFSQTTGDVRNVCDLKSFPEAFAFGHGNVLVSSGDVVSLTAGSTVQRLAFPMTDYTDPESDGEADV